jgi:hypothetical protein
MLQSLSDDLTNGLAASRELVIFSPIKLFQRDKCPELQHFDFFRRLLGSFAGLPAGVGPRAESLIFMRSTTSIVLARRLRDSLCEVSNIARILIFVKHRAGKFSGGRIASEADG